MEHSDTIRAHALGIEYKPSKAASVSRRFIGTAETRSIRRMEEDARLRLAERVSELERRVMCLEHWKIIGIAALAALAVVVGRAMWR